ncbi:MAG: tetratricopeptide repeat protein [Myxococcota bacterium]
MAINRDKVLASAIKLLQGGKYDKAVAEFQRLVDDDPKDVRTILKIGDTYVKMGQPAEAIKRYERVATIYSEQGFYLKAVAVFKQMLRVDGQLPEVHLKLAEMYQQLGLISDSLQHFQQVAVFYEQAGRHLETLSVLKRMVDLDPDNLPSRIKLAELFAQQGQTAEAVTEFRSAAAYLVEQERVDDFVRVAERLIFFDPAALDITRQLADTYLKRKEPKLALGKLQVCFKADPRNVETLLLIAQAFSEMGQLPKTISVYKEAARIHEAEGGLEEARRLWRKVLELDAGDGEAARALQGGGAAPAAHVPAAQATPRPAVDPTRDQIARLMTETDVYVKYGLRDKAVEHLQKILALDADHLEAHDRLRTVYQAAKNWGGQVEALRNCVRLGEALRDPRVHTWRAEVEALLAAPPASPPKPSLHAQADQADDDDEFIVDPALDDEPLDFSEEGLPPDEALDVAGPSSMGPALPADDEVLLSADEGGALPDDADLYLIDEDSAAEPDHPANEAALALSPPSTAPSLSVSSPPPGFDTGVSDAAALDATATHPLIDSAVSMQGLVDPLSLASVPMMPESEDGAYAATRVMSLSPAEIAALNLSVSSTATTQAAASPTTLSPSVSPAPQVTDLDAIAVEAAPAATASAARNSPTTSERKGARPVLEAGDMAAAGHGFEDDPVMQFFAAEVGEAEFFLRQGLVDEAREILDEVLDEHPDSPRVRWMLARAQALDNGDPEPPAPWAEKIIGEVAAEIGDIEDDLPFPADPTEQVSALEVLGAFKRGVKDTIADDDAETHYNLGIAYREMGLLNDAVTELRLASASPKLYADASHVIGLILLDQARHQEALQVFDEVLRSDVTTVPQRAVAHYERGVCFEGLGDLREALVAYEAAAAQGAQVRDLKTRIDRVRAKVAGSAAAPADLEFSGGDENGGTGSRKNVDYL